jgi:SpoIID/LytB domain protein
MDPGNGYPDYEVECRWCRRHPVAWQATVPDSIRPPRPDNEASRLEFARQWGWGALPGSAFTVEHGTNNTVIKGHSLGHGVGMCQLGAIGMAKSGASYGSILELYYPGTRITRLDSR